MSIRVAVVSAYDASTGWSTLPVAAVGWSQGWSWWDWVPLSAPARELRYTVIEGLDPAERERWLQRFFDEPTATYSVSEVLVLDNDGREAAEQAVRDTLDQLLVEGA
ncbi:hypothetical protein [Mycobacterium hubeiense]|uniref:hypothetical protein n=1 Tax=Mycobacterium hubeiense TaxID=1867256 RepID=UPI000C7F3951|nr:hypothetical protein [Mycobacterium sp. QGD 101]